MNEEKKVVKEKSTKLSIVAFVLSFIPCVNIASFVMAIIDLAKNGRTHKKGFSIAAIVLSAPMVLIMVLASSTHSDSKVEEKECVVESSYVDSEDLSDVDSEDLSESLEYTEEDLYREYPNLKGSELINETSLKNCLENPSVREALSKQQDANDEEVSKHSNIPGWSIECDNCLAQAESYLSWEYWSVESLKHQLEYEKYPSEVIETTMKAVEPEIDWNEQCVGKGRSYIYTGDFSLKSLKHQLEYEGFTSEQIEYSEGILVDEVDWNAECLDNANSYLDSCNMSKAELENQLEYEGYTSDQIQFALSEIYK